MTSFSVYAVRNQEGKWLKLGGVGRWVDDIAYARIYIKLKQARAMVTFRANTWPELGIAEIVEFVVLETNVLKEEARVEKMKQKKLLRVEAQKRRLAKWQLDRAQKDLNRAQQEIERLKSL